MMLAGYLVGVGHLSLRPAFAALEGGTLLVASILRWVGRLGGRPLIRRYGRYFHLDERRWALAERWFSKHGPLSIVLGRLIPGLRMVTSFVAGVFDVPYPVFLPYVALGSSLYILLFMALGLALGKETSSIVRLFWPHPLVFALVALALLAFAVLVVWLRRKARDLWG